MAACAILLHWFLFVLFYSFKWGLRLCYFYVLPRGENTPNEKAFHRRGFPACECLRKNKKSRADTKKIQIMMMDKQVLVCFVPVFMFLFFIFHKVSS